MSRRWRLWGTAIAVLFCLAVVVCATYFYGVLTALNQRRHDHQFLFRRQSQVIYHLASKGAYDDIRDLKLAEPDDLKKLERDHGKIRSWSIERVFVRELGLPGYVEVRVERNTTQMELITFMSRGGAASVGIPWENYERDIFGSAGKD
jgi:hypothetical protein